MLVSNPIDKLSKVLYDVLIFIAFWGTFNKPKRRKMMNINWSFNLNDDYCCHSADIRCADPNSDVSLDEPLVEDIVTIFREGNIDDYYGECGFWAYGELRDGRFFMYEESWDYTFSNACLVLGKSREEIERYGLSSYQREQLGIILPELEA